MASINPGTSGEARLFQLRVALRDIRPPVWRRLLVPDDIHLGRLHRVLNATMGWEDAHMHVFTVG